jgi:hypothetical protein
VVHGATAEDLNLPVKWTGWHHFYFPGASLDTAFRQASDARVRELWEEALEAARHGDLERAFDRAGHLAHHVEDMASPPHVVPVNHGLSDGFERYGVRDSLVRAARREVVPLPGDEAQRALARETLAAVRTESLATRDGALPWSAFWAEPASHGPGAFGHYGSEVGNAFGALAVRWNGHERPVEPEGYAVFMDERVSGAVAYARAFLEWASDQLEAAATSAEPVALRRFHPAPELSLQFLGGLTRDSRGTTPILGLRASLPLPRAFMLSVDWRHGVGLLQSHVQPAGGSLAVLSPPLWTARPGYAVGVDLRASAGVGLFPWAGERRWGCRSGCALMRPWDVRSPSAPSCSTKGSSLLTRRGLTECLSLWGWGWSGVTGRWFHASPFSGISLRAHDPLPISLLGFGALQRFEDCRSARCWLLACSLLGLR